MDLSLSDDQQSIVEGFDRFLERECTPERVRAAEPLGFDADLWKQLTEMGLTTLALPEDAGGGAFGLLDAALVTESAGARLVPAPFVEAAVAVRAVVRAGQSVPADGLVTFALHPAVDGVARLVPGGAVADAVVALDGDALVVAPLGAGPRPSPANLGSAPVADRDVRSPERLVLAAGGDGLAAHQRALDEWRVLMASALTGIAGAALDVAIAYVKERHQFGVPIGSFQTVQHRLADLATAVDGARLLSREAAWAADTGAGDAAALASMAILHCARTADQATAAALHYHGGYGFMLEYDIQLYLRRARAWRLALGDLADEEQVLADRLYGPVGTGV